MTTTERHALPRPARQLTAGDKSAMKRLPPEAFIFGGGQVTLDPVREFDDEVARKSPAYAAARARIRAQQQATAAASKPDAFAARREAEHVEAEQAARAIALSRLFGCTPAQARLWMYTGKIV